MNRLLLLSAILSLILFELSCGSDSAKTNDPRPNILFILADDLGKEWVSCYGAEDIQTPHIDQMAKEGLMFDHAWSMPQCTPSRLTLFTGQYPYKHGWINHWDVPRWGGGCHYDWRVNQGMARVLQDGGYNTIVAGKWQVNDFRVQPDAMQQHGFDDYCMWTGYEAGNPPSGERYWNPYIYTKEGSKTYQDEFGPDIFTDFLVEAMRNKGNKPLFMYYPMCLPHTPFVETPDEQALGDDKLAKHKAMVRYVDKMVGKLRKGLEETGLAENTIVVFTTDNGTTGSVSGKRDGQFIKGGKGNTVEAGVDAPFLVLGPGVPKGKRTGALTDFTDIFPTFAELAGIPLADSLDLHGTSMAEVIQGKTNLSPREWIMSMGGKNRARLTAQGVENEYYYRDRVLRNTRYKLYIDSDRKAEKFFDLQDDPYESNNLINSEDSMDLAAFNILQQIAATFPQQDADPVYIPLPPRDWDTKKVSAESQIWKIGHPNYKEDAVLGDL